MLFPVDETRNVVDTPCSRPLCATIAFRGKPGWAVFLRRGDEQASLFAEKLNDCIPVLATQLI